MSNSVVLKESQIVMPPEIESMFSYKSKLREKIPDKWLKRYKQIYRHLREMIAEGKLPTHPNYLGDAELPSNIYERKYLLRDLNSNLIEKTPEDLFVRVASTMGAVEESLDKGKEYAEKFYIHMYMSHWLPGGRVLAGAGDLYRLKTLANCFVTKIEDDTIEAIYKAAYEAARTYSYGGGDGIDLSVLRPAGSVVHNAANTSTGAVSFATLYSSTTGLIGQNGRRGALMLTLDVKHPDILKFIKIKNTPDWSTNQIINQLKWKGKFTDEQIEEIKKTVVENMQIRFANISIKVSDEFMHTLMEEKEHGPNTILIYKKLKKGKVMDIFQDGKKVHYSYGIPSKDLRKYELFGKFKTFEEANKFIYENFGVEVDKQKFDDAKERDIFGDYVVELKNYDYDLAVRRAGDFLLYFGSKPTGSVKVLVKAMDIWASFVESNYKTAEPGIMYWSRHTKYSTSNYLGRPIIGTNPCGEVPLEDGGACNLGSINLVRYVKEPFTEKADIDWDTLREAVHDLVRFLDNVIEWNSYLNPLEKQREAAKATRRIGLGVMGIADMLLTLGLKYDEEEGIKKFEEVMKFITNEAYKASAMLAAEKGKAEIFEVDKAFKNPFFKEALDDEVRALIKENGLRNVGVMSIAPTGTIALIAISITHKDKNYIGVSSGIEPIFALYYKRRSETMSNKTYKVFHSTVQAYLDMKNLTNVAQKATTDEELETILPEHFFRTAHKIDPFMRVKIQAIAQKYIDHSISSTINLPEDIEPEIMSKLYIEGWKMGLKGLTVYRDGSRYPILSVEGEKTEFQKWKDKKFKLKFGEKEVIVRGDEVIRLPDGRLTTVYHGIKSGIFEYGKIVK